MRCFVTGGLVMQAPFGRWREVYGLDVRCGFGLGRGGVGGQRGELVFRILDRVGIMDLYR